MHEFVEVRMPYTYAKLEDDFIEYSSKLINNSSIWVIYSYPNEHKCRLLSIMREIYIDLGGYYCNLKLKRVNNHKFNMYGNAELQGVKYFIKITSDLEIYVQSEKEIKEYLDINNLWEKL